MKDVHTIKLHHDVLIAVANEKIDLQLPPDELNKARIALDALCWVLDHPENNAFADAMHKLMMRAKQYGYGYYLEHSNLSFNSGFHS